MTIGVCTMEIHLNQVLDRVVRVVEQTPAVRMIHYQVELL